jgi:predicted neuraminidase
MNIQSLIHIQMKKHKLILPLIHRSNRWYLLIFIFSALIMQDDKVKACLPEDKLQKSFFQSEPVFPPQSKHVHGSSIVELPNGDLLCCWFEGSGERSANDVMIKGARLKKGGNQWSETFVMADTPNNPDCNPLLFLDGKNHLHLVWIVVVANKWESSILKTRISTNYLNDGAPEWNWQDIILLKPGEEFADKLCSGFKELETPDLAWGGYAPKYEAMMCEAAKDATKRETGWMSRIKPLILPEGRILLPLYSDGFNLSLMAISDDDGDNWIPSFPVVGRGNIQPALVRKKDGSLVAYMRDNGDFPGRIMKSTSSDNGYTWSIVNKTSLPNPGSSVDAISLADGSWILVYNDLEQGRNRLAVSLSEDEGETWKWTKYLENKNPGEGGFAYPTVIQGKNGIIHVSYSHHIKEDKTIQHASFTEEWIKEKQTQPSIIK